VRIQHRPATGAEQAEQLLDVADRVPADLAAGGGEFLDRFPERQRAGADGAVLDVDDQQRGTGADPGVAPEAGWPNNWNRPIVLLLKFDKIYIRGQSIRVVRVTLAMHPTWRLEPRGDRE
jgi:hypothetical protein